MNALQIAGIANQGTGVAENLDDLREFFNPASQKQQQSADKKKRDPSDSKYQDAIQKIDLLQTRPLST